MAPSSLYSIDPTSGSATLIGPIGFSNVTGLEVLPDGRLVGTANADNIVPSGGPAAVFIEIDRLTGAGTAIDILFDLGGAGDCGRMPDVSYDPVSGVLYGYGDFCNAGNEGLWSIDPVTGAATFIGATGFTGGGNGLAAQPGTGVLYATPFDQGSLVTIDPVTGVGTDVPGSATNVLFRVNALAFQPGTGALFGSHSDGTNSFLVTIDVSNGVTTIIGSTIAGLDALVFASSGIPGATVPVLDNLGMAILAVLITAMAAWRMKKLQGAA